MHIIIAEINALKGYDDFYLGEHEHSFIEIKKLNTKIQEYLINKGVENIQIDNVYDFENLNEIVATSSKPIILFSNIPPDCSYISHRVLVKGRLKMVRADSYLQSIYNFIELLKMKQLDLHIITGADEKMLQDRNILALSKDCLITVKRKKDWLDEGNYQEKYENYVLEKIEESIEKSRQKI